MHSLLLWHLSLAFIGSLRKLIVMVLVAVIKYLTQATWGVDSDWESEGIVSNGREVVAVATDSGSHCIPNQETDRWMSFLWPLCPFTLSRTPDPGKVTTTWSTPYQLNLSGNTLTISMVILSPQELTVKTTMIRSERMTKQRSSQGSAENALPST